MMRVLGFGRTSLFKVGLVTAATLLAAGLLALAGIQTRQANAVDAPQYTVTDLGSIPDDADSVAVAINNSGQVVGDLSSRSPAPNPMAFLYENGTMSELGTLPGGVTSSANGINETAQIVGESYVTDLGTRRAFLYDNGTMTNLGTLPNPGTFGGSTAYDINDSGQVVGESDTLEGSTDGHAREHAFLYEGGSMKDLDTLGISNTISHAVAINNSGQIVGSVDIPAGSTSRATAFLYENGTMTDLGARMGEVSSSAEDISDSGQIVGVISSIVGAEHAFLYDTDGTVTDLGTLPGDSSSVAQAVNSSGQVVGVSRSGVFGQPTAFLYSGGTMTNLNELIPADSGWRLFAAHDINDSGMIVGFGIHPNGDQRAFLLAPQYNFGSGSGGSFGEPVRDNELNQLKAGASVPVKFGLGGDFGLNIFATATDGTKYPKSKQISCSMGLPPDPVEVTTVSKSGLTYDAASGIYTYVWKTDRDWKGTCRELNVKLADGTDHLVKFEFK